MILLTFQFWFPWNSFLKFNRFVADHFLFSILSFWILLFRSVLCLWLFDLVAGVNYNWTCPLFDGIELRTVYSLLFVRLYGIDNEDIVYHIALLRFWLWFTSYIAYCSSPFYWNVWYKSLFMAWAKNALVWETTLLSWIIFS